MTLSFPVLCALVHHAVRIPVECAENASRILCNLRNLAKRRLAIFIQVLRAKLLTSIFSGTGFELS